MKRVRHFETAPTGGQNEAEKMAGMLAALYHDVRLLNLDIEAELANAGCDGRGYALPIAARTMGARRDNLKATIAMLEQRLSFITAGRARRLSDLS
jgi:hypothetical protein